VVENPVKTPPFQFRLWGAAVPMVINPPDAVSRETVRMSPARPVVSIVWESAPRVMMAD
jgi:hypothetical protein